MAYYYCSSHIRSKTCTSHSINKELLKKIVLETINKQIELLIDLDNNIEKVIKKENINYDYEILSVKKKETEKDIKKYSELLSSLKEDLINKFISHNEFAEYSDSYRNKIEKLNNQLITINNQIDNINMDNNCNIYAIENFIKAGKIENLNRKIIDELIDEIYIDEDKNVKIKFNYEDVFLDAIDFMEKNVYNKKCS